VIEGKRMTRVAGGHLEIGSRHRTRGYSWGQVH
jgi:hypothetical protein